MSKCSFVKCTQQTLLVLCVAICLVYMLFESGILKDFRYPRVLKNYEEPSLGIERKLTPRIAPKHELNGIRLRNPSSANYTYSSGFSPEYNESDEMPRKKMQAVIIVASYRTGSSFIGQLFNQHPDVFYLFEPLFFSNWPRVEGQSVDKVAEDLLLCKMDSMRDEIHRAWTEATENYRKELTFILRKRLKQTQVCMEKGLCFRGKSKAICTEEMCGNISSIDCKSCLAPPPDLMKKACLNAKVRVLKVIRIEDLGTLKKAWNHPDIELKIIHLVRDPRATLLSRLRLHREMRPSGQVVASTCRRNVRIQTQYLSNDTEFQWLKGNYKLVRYEDVIENPLLFAKKLYDFINYENFNFNTEVQEWIQQSTNRTDYNLFGTSRDVNKQKYKWRTQISLQLLKDVQVTCRDMMSLLGYKLVQSRGQLYNYTNTLLAPWRS